MELTKSQYQRIEPFLPRQRGHVSLSNLQVLKAILYVAKQGVLDRVFSGLQQQQIIRVQVEAVSLDSSAVKVHPDGTGALKKTGRKPVGNPVRGGPPRFIWLPQMLERR